MSFLRTRSFDRLHYKIGGLGNQHKVVNMSVSKEVSVASCVFRVGWMFVFSRKLVDSHSRS